MIEIINSIKTVTSRFSGSGTQPYQKFNVNSTKSEAEIIFII